jgi:myo-inositol-1(or 4)-monophosphatase
MPVLDLAERLAAAERVTRAAGALARGYFDRRRELAIELKGAQDLVSVADRETETAVVEGLRAAFPGEAVLGEEHGLQGRAGGPVWIVDPIDGTANFLRGVAFWCVSLGLWVEGEAVLGVVHDPVRGETFAAARGLGASCDGRPMRASACADPARARFNVGFNHKQSIDRHTGVIKRLFAAGAEYTRVGSAALGLAYTADGRCEGFWESRINAWDVCAGLVLVREAGGATDDFFARQGPERVAEILAAAPGVASFFREATRA